MARLHYLESLDSVRAAPVTARLDDPRGPLVVDANEDHVYLEVLMSLALGRDVVVPYSYAFDSLPFLDVAVRVLEQRPPGVQHDRPFRVHCHGHRTYRDAVRAMLSRVGDPDNPFVSSLLPHLAQEDPAVVAAMADDPDLLLSWSGNSHASDMQTVMDELGSAPPVARSETPPVPLADRVRAIADPASELSSGVSGLDPTAQEVHRRLADALVALGALTAPEGFRQRSSLRGDGVWPADGRRTAREIVGDEALALVVEAVDTLYNHVVVDSISGASASFSTSVDVGEDLHRARAVAQHIALAAARPGRSATDDDADPAFEVRVAAEQVGAPVPRPLLDIKDSVFHDLLAARNERSRRGTTPPFWQSVATVDEAAASGDRAKARRALDAHLRTVAALLPSGTGVWTTATGKVGLGMMTFAGASVPSFSSLATLIPGPVGWAAGAGAVMPATIAGAHGLWQDRARTRRVASAFIEMTEVTR